ncbi:MAG: Dam family site-specific DNA-(adenine-N6)-methyltransferase [Dehalococcoidia bacterium]|nr:Dam family site-specific DNA-(adenine-N6)-methyltransferase [Dehalococcoidia bacterium]
MARPFLKWAGGKGKLAPRIVAAAPRAFARYHEPFLGAGAVFFAFEAEHPAMPATLSDANAELIATFAAVRDHTGTVACGLRELAERYRDAGQEARAALYYSIRAESAADAVAAAVRFIFLNKTCYNGLYRVNAAGAFNVPHGRYVHPRIVDPEALHDAAKALARADLRVQDFAAACDAANPGDFVYLDPPYQPLSQTASFTAYTKADFGAADQERLRDAFDRLTQRGVAAILSNSDHPAIRDLYAGRGYSLEVVAMSRAINSKTSARKPIGELLISNLPALR